MKALIDDQGRIRWGIYDEPIQDVNYLDYNLQTPMGLTLPKSLKRILANQFHFIGIMGPEIIGGLAVVDLKYLANGFFYLYDRQTKHLYEATALSVSGANIKATPEQTLSTFSSGGLTIDINSSRVSAKGKGISLTLDLDTQATKPLRICTRAGYRGWVYTQKTSPVLVRGSAKVGHREIEVSSPSTMALMDWTCGYMRRKTCWNWAASAATLPDGRSFGLNLSCGVNETSFTENAFWIDGAMTKVDTVNYIFEAHELMKPWIITSFDKKVDLTFCPEASRGEKINTGFVASRFTQLIGMFEGTLTTDSGEMIQIKDVPGFTEDHYAKW
jgi:hypothetical protein